MQKRNRGVQHPEYGKILSVERNLYSLSEYDRHEEDKPVIIILGPTGVGKTEISVFLARSIGTEIISADSMQIYRHMDIGTAKPTRGDTGKVRHHMIDIVEPSESFSTGRYIEMVRPLIEGLHCRGKIPLIVGGTGLYIRAMTRGFFSGPSADWGLRDELLSMEQGAPGSLFDYLKRLDPDAAEKVMAGDKRRVIRAIEVCLRIHKGISELQRSFTIPLPYRFIKIGLTRERGELYRAIERRVDMMISRGLVDEVKHLYELTLGKTARQAIGYKEIADYLKGAISLDEAVSLIKKRTKNYAKRQFTWFRKEPGVTWIDVTGLSGPMEVFRAIAIMLKID
jgi:tRNA dimethylallyltransferase